MTTKYLVSLKVWNFDSGRPIPFDKDVTVMIFTSCAFPSGDRILTISPSSDDRQKGELTLDLPRSMSEFKFSLKTP